MLGVHVSISRASIAKATNCLDEGLIYGDGWDWHSIPLMDCFKKDKDSSQMKDKAKVFLKVFNIVFLPNDINENDEEISDFQKL